MKTQIDQIISLQRLHSMGDWLHLGNFDHRQLMAEISPFDTDWVQYNPRKPNSRFGLSVTSLDGKLGGVPDLDSLSEYNKENSTNITNQSISTPTVVYEKSPTLQKVLAPYQPWLGRCHFIRLDEGGFFPDHYDINKLNLDEEEIRLIAFINNCEEDVFSFCYDGRLLNNIKNGQLFYFNASKRHKVFSTGNNSIQLVVTLKFDPQLFSIVIENYI